MTGRVYVDIDVQGRLITVGVRKCDDGRLPRMPTQAELDGATSHVNSFVKGCKVVDELTVVTALREAEAYLQRRMAQWGCA